MRDLEEDESDDQRKQLRTEVTHHPVDVEMANDWTSALQRLNKGKMTLDRQVCLYFVCYAWVMLNIIQDLLHISNVLSDIQDKIKHIGADILEVSRAPWRI